MKFHIILMFAAMLAGAMSDPGDDPSDDRCWRKSQLSHWKAGCDFPGDDLLEFKNIHEISFCQQSCVENKKCNYFTFNFEKNTCSLKQLSSHRRPIEDDSSLCGFIETRTNVTSLKLDRAPLSHFSYATGHTCWIPENDGLPSWGIDCDLSGITIDEFQTDSLTDCRKRCVTNQQCTHFVFNYVKNNCKNMKLPTDRNLNQRWVGHLICGGIDERIYPGTHFPKKVVVSTTKPTVTTERITSAATTKPTVTTERITSAATVVSTTKPTVTTERNTSAATVGDDPSDDRCWRKNQFSRWKAGCDFPGDELKEMKGIDLFYDCQESCVGNKKCNYFTFNFEKNTCSLKQLSSHRRPIEDDSSLCGFIETRTNVTSLKMNKGPGDEQYALSHRCWIPEKDGLPSWGINCELNGIIIDEFQTHSLTDCRKRCVTNQQCTHFVFNYVKNNCKNMKLPTDRNLKERFEWYLICGGIDERIYPGTHFPKKVVVSTTQPTVSTERITSAKTVVSTTQPTVSKSCWNTADTSPSSIHRRTYWSENCDFKGRDMGQIPKSSLNNCRISCSNNKPCTHFTFNVKRDICFLKNSDKSDKPFPSNIRKERNCGFILNRNESLPMCPF